MLTDAPKDIAKLEITNDNGEKHRCKRVRLKVVVDECMKRWFKEYLIAAEEGDPEMQLLVGQMFNSGYGVERDLVKGKYWLAKARSRHEDHQNNHG